MPSSHSMYSSSRSITTVHTQSLAPRLVCVPQVVYHNKSLRSQELPVFFQMEGASECGVQILLNDFRGLKGSRETPFENMVYRRIDVHINVSFPFNAAETEFTQSILSGLVMSPS